MSESVFTRKLLFTRQLTVDGHYDLNVKHGGCYAIQDYRLHMECIVLPHDIREYTNVEDNVNKIIMSYVAPLLWLALPSAAAEELAKQPRHLPLSPFKEYSSPHWNWVRSQKKIPPPDLIPMVIGADAPTPPSHKTGLNGEQISLPYIRDEMAMNHGECIGGSEFKFHRERPGSGSSDFYDEAPYNLTSSGSIMQSGRWAWEVKLVGQSYSEHIVGVRPAADGPLLHIGLGGRNGGRGWALDCYNGAKVSHTIDGSRQGARNEACYAEDKQHLYTQIPSTVRKGSNDYHARIGVRLDLDLGTLEFFANGLSSVSLGIAFTNVVGPVRPAVSCRLDRIRMTTIEIM